jgi:hypothetical protein
MHEFSTAATTSSGLLHRLRAPQAGAPVPVGVSRWLTRTVWAAHLCQGGFGFAILAQIIHRLSWRSGGSTGGTRRRDRDPRRRTLAVRRGGRGNATQSGRMIPPLQQTVCESSGLRVRASRRLAPTSLRDENLCIIRAGFLANLAYAFR